MQQMTQNKNEAGFTLLELLLVVGVGALLLIGGISTYRLVSESNKVADTTRLVMTIRNEAQNLAQGQGYAGVEAALKAGKVIPDTGTLRNPFGGALTLNAGDTLSVAVDKIPTNACKKLAMSIKDPSIQLNGAAVPANLTAAAGVCGDPDNNTLTWTFP